MSGNTFLDEFLRGVLIGSTLYAASLLIKSAYKENVLSGRALDRLEEARERREETLDQREEALDQREEALDRLEKNLSQLKK